MHRDRGMALMTFQGPSWPLKSVDPVHVWVMPQGWGEEGGGMVGGGG